ncbi:Spore coat polysaccharide biosynthesis protein predicted glycosyltransferase-like protein [Candidatus Desulforudis audaxviator MP104C]|uniref:Spore coat polysaccharide biosynthesis protein predicted glycosyltransferase-like protein n=1 Tax=Desulforudis audaxviator (strain MP104C) TaxID=477974 RepID=B1I5G3_DESAP|nr:Spore coat polysaccharide biosynthesis protein predicted glycosyltransferase-like protein [Candidatus Desulforudis audaxviator MP104C]
MLLAGSRYNRTLIIRADANTRIGTGHLMRCLALAQAWKDRGGRVVLITACESEGLLQRLHDEGLIVIKLTQPYPNPVDWKVTSDVLAQHPGAWVVLDGYHFDSEYQRRVKTSGHKLLIIDDMAHLEHYYADVVLNQNLHAEELNYSCESYTRLLLGTRYVLLRREFLKWQGWQRNIPEMARKVLVTLGGSDPDNVTLKVIQALQLVEVDGMEAVVVVGGTNSHYKELQSAVEQLRFYIRLESNVPNMPELMAWSDVAISAGGITVWELAFMGVPIVGLSQAEQEKVLLQGSTNSGISVNLGGHRYIEPRRIAEVLTGLVSNRDQRAAMSRAGRALVDGFGSARVITLEKENQA